MKKNLLLLALTAACASAQPASSSLEQLKFAAVAGEPAAQDKLAVAYVLRSDPTNAEVWYRKAAQQGYAHSAGQLGHLLLNRSRLPAGLKPSDQGNLEQEALKWISLAANSGDKLGQADLACIYLDGKLAKQDLIEAYKWGELAGAGVQTGVAPILGLSARDTAGLKMNESQIAEARKRAAEFVPRQSHKSDLPDPAWVQKIKLNGTSGTPGHRFAVINNKTFGQGDQLALKIGDKRVAVLCVEIRESSALVVFEGLEGTRELRMP